MSFSLLSLSLQKNVCPEKPVLIRFDEFLQFWKPVRFEFDIFKMIVFEPIAQIRLG